MEDFFVAVRREILAILPHGEGGEAPYPQRSVEAHILLDDRWYEDRLHRWMIHAVIEGAVELVFEDVRTFWRKDLQQCFQDSAMSAVDGAGGIGQGVVVAAEEGGIF